MRVRVEREAVVAFRLAAHHLTARLPADRLHAAAGSCGIQNTPPGSALLALHARVEGITRDAYTRALDIDKSLLQTWSLRGAPYVVPTADAAVFTTGVLPPDEGAARQLILGVGPALDRLGLTLADAVSLVDNEVRVVLAGARLAITELGAQVADRIAPRLSDPQREAWTSEGPYAPGQPWGEAVVHFCLRILTLRQVVCFAARAGNQAPFALVDEWLPAPIPALPPAQARAELLRRYLHAYGPSTRSHFAAWLGVRAGDVDPWWSLVEDELVSVELGARAWMLADDVAALQSAAMPTGVRLLPPHDPYTQVRDRDTIVDPLHHREVWRSVGDPGTVLADGEIVGTWRPRTAGRRLTLTMRTFAIVPERVLALVREEAERVAALRGAVSVTAQVSAGP